MKSEQTRHYHRQTADQWLAMIERFNQCEQSGAAFCRDNGISYASFCKWRQLFSNTENSTKHNGELSAPAFIDLSLLPNKNVSLRCPSLLVQAIC